jgi:hypothetical protein
MQIEIEELVSTKGNGAFWGHVKRRGMNGGHVQIKLNNGNNYEFNLQDFVFYIAHRTAGKGFTTNIKKYEEGN